ncbi:thrombopoietin-like isoform X2 [Sebastes fasciatus]|uniref:thrombopoietin-like isoform X2 n=1 Tax=Sebastes fasciatus TaxID=394691 RepID=UPI003D9F65F0
MAYSRLLLLLIGVISSHLPEVQARPTDFWCNRQARKNMEERIEMLKTDMAGCVGADTLPSPVQLPCVSVHTAEWANKTLHQKRSEVVGALQVFRDGVQGARNQTTLDCQTSLLEKLGHHIANYLAIVNRLQIQNGTVTPPHFAVQNCSSRNSTSEVLKQYGNLLKGKLERLAIDLQDGICKVEHRTTNTKGPCS